MLVNQPYTLTGWYFNLVVRCNCCDEKPVVLLAGGVGAMNQCPQCKTFVQVADFKKEADGTLTFMFNKLAMVNPDEQQPR